MSATIDPQKMLCTPCLQRLCDRCVGRCLCTHNDPTVMAAQALALTMAQYRQIMPDAVYAMALEHLDALRLMLPVPIALPAAASF